MRSRLLNRECFSTPSDESELDGVTLCSGNFPTATAPNMKKSIEGPESPDELTTVQLTSLEINHSLVRCRADTLELIK